MLNFYEENKKYNELKEKLWKIDYKFVEELVDNELIYIMAHPTHTGYGVSPLEVAAYIITSSLLAEQMNIDYFKNSYVWESQGVKRAEFTNVVHEAELNGINIFYENIKKMRE